MRLEKLGSCFANELKPGLFCWIPDRNSPAIVTIENEPRVIFLAGDQDACEVYELNGTALFTEEWWIEVDPASVIDPTRQDKPLGAISVKGPMMFIHAKVAEGTTGNVALIQGSAGGRDELKRPVMFSRWQIMAPTDSGPAVLYSTPDQPIHAS
ncbi:hypothetical protein [Sphingomonas sp. ABOLF]|uniref:hypothetical protein n=1 Tax=Sphingomonas sp. ABOLF TaxID=1985879 RepID=UPI000F7D9615|nr:hypothetical protein [Sphingomonas sp. ABOLF]